MPNRRNNCWFNSCVQAIITTSALPILLSAPEEMFDIRHQGFLSFLRTYASFKNSIPANAIKIMLRKLTEDRNSTIMFGQQNDAHEFFNMYMGEMLRRMSLNITKLRQTIICKECGDIGPPAMNILTEITVAISVEDGAKCNRPKGR